MLQKHVQRCLDSLLFLKQSQHSQVCLPQTNWPLLFFCAILQRVCPCLARLVILPGLGLLTRLCIHDTVSCEWIPLNSWCVTSLWSIWKLCDPSGLLMGGVSSTLHVFFCLSKQNKHTLKGIQANAGMINTAVGCRDTHCSQVRVGLWKSRMKRGKRAASRGVNKTWWGRGGRKKKMPGGLLVWNWGQVFSHKDLVRKTRTHAFKQHTLMSTSGSHSGLSEKSNILPLM